MGLENRCSQSIYASVVHVTDRCNFACEHCAETKGTKDMTPSDFKDVLEWQQNPGSKRVVVYGGEVRIHPQLKEIVGKAKEKNLKVVIFTNGYGMSDPKKTVNILNELSDMGIDSIAISTDQEHKKYAERKGITIDYKYIGEICNSMIENGTDVKKGIKGNIEICSAGNAEYVLPLGHAKSLTWKRRMESGLFGYDPKRLKKLQKQLGKEFSSWYSIAWFSHTCYCNPANLVKRSENSKIKNEVVNWMPHINTDKSVTACPFNILPELGSIDNLSAEGAFEKVNSNLLYNIISHEGPQGVARLIGNTSEGKLKEKFIERTPCGLCEDLAETNYSDLQEMIDTPKE